MLLYLLRHCLPIIPSNRLLKYILFQKNGMQPKGACLFRLTLFVLSEKVRWMDCSSSSYPVLQLCNKLKLEERMLGAA